MYRRNTLGVLNIASLVLVFSLAAGCTSGSVGGSRTITGTVNISYDANGCPSAANATNIQRGKPGDYIVFQSDINEKFWISFDPFKKSKHPSNGKGYLDLKLRDGSLLPISENPAGQKYNFKYIILAKNCPPIDPMIIIER